MVDTLFDPELRVVEDQEALARQAAAFLVEKLEESGSPVLTLPTGDTPLGLYKYLAAHYASRRGIWDRARFVALDEYAGLEPDHPQSFRRWLGEAILDPLEIPPQHRHWFRADAPDPDREAARVEAWLEENGPLDIAVLGLGMNGHLAFNEPGSAPDSPVRLTDLAPETIAQNARYWGDESLVPRRAYTLGLRALLGARRIVLLVSGGAKSAILARTLHGPVGPPVPASFLRTRPGVTVIADREAAGEISS